MTAIVLQPGDLVCEWYALCRQDAGGVVDHPALGWVPTCLECAGIAHERLHPLDGEVLEEYLTQVMAGRRG